eukprot:3310340-Alexandrium_andersonii.AAC.1
MTAEGPKCRRVAPLRAERAPRARWPPPGLDNGTVIGAMRCSQLEGDRTAHPAPISESRGLGGGTRH